jgi:hypothetical protein
VSDEQIEQAVQALEDEEVRQRVADGDFADVEGFGLTAEVTGQIQTLAAELPDIQDRLGKAIEALQDDDVRQRVAEGNFSDLESLGLTAEDTEQLRTMATEWSEVDGFVNPGADGFVKGPSLIFERRFFIDTRPLRLRIHPRTLDRTVSTQPLGGLDTGGGATV